ncbi:MAG TPA: M1 family metallopeptidase [Kofleriaceae bacterium]
MRSSLWVAIVVVSACGSSPKTVAPPPEAAPPVAAMPPPVPPAPSYDVSQVRLPRFFLPTAYRAQLAIDPAKDGFDGKIEIAGVVKTPSAKLFLHGRKLDIASASARDGKGEVPLTHTLHGEDVLEFTAPRALEGDTTLKITYRGVFDPVNTTGAFKQIVKGQPYIFSQFEAIYARRVFPCLDEPDNKVPWELSLDVPAKLVAVANAPEASSTTTGATKHVVFKATKPLPSYLIAFGVGPFEIVDAGKTKSGTPVRIITLAGRAADGAYAAKTTARTVDLLEEYFGIPYPYEKLDMLSIPITVGFGAMENAGLITFTESLILLDKPSKQHENVWVVVSAHELAHQWFGDLVTTAWWDDIWLNEGFANWMEKKIGAKFDPTWHEEQSELDMRDGALEADSVVSARKIRQPIEKVDDILDAFDGITYDKGASILNMFESYLGAETFQKGVRQYLKDHAFGNSTSADFAAAISKASGKDVTAAFATFLDQNGAPEVGAAVSCGGGAASVTLSQRRHLPPGSAAPAEQKPWLLPVCIAYDADGKRAETCTMLDGPSATVTLAAKACPAWILPNANGRGYYRVAYTAAQITALRDIAWKTLSWTERRVVFSDLEDAIANGQQPLALGLSFVPKMLAGGDRFTIGPAVGAVTGVEALVPDELRGKYDEYLRRTFGPGAAKAGLVPKASDDLDTERTRHQLVAAAAESGHDPKLIAEAVKLAKDGKWRDVPQAMRTTVLALAVDADQKIFEKTLHDAPLEEKRQTRTEMYQALAHVHDVAKQQLVLSLVADPKLDIRETWWMMFGNLDHDANRAAAQAFFKAHAQELMKRMPGDETAGPIASGAALFTSSCREDDRAAVGAYVKDTFGKLPGGERVVAQELEEMDQCIARRKLLEPEIRSWLGGAKFPKDTGKAGKAAAKR